MLISLIRTLLIYTVIIFGIRIMGKRQISQLQTTELVATLLISDLAVIPMQDSGQPLTSGLVPILALIAIEIIISVVMLKSSKFRKVICGKPIIVIEKGKVLQSAMRELRISTEDLFEQLRQKDVFSLADVKYAIVETNGTLTILKNDSYNNVRLKDINLTCKDNQLEVVVVSDGELCVNSLAVCGKDANWAHSTLLKEKAALKDVFIMCCDLNGKYSIIKKDDKK